MPKYNVVLSITSGPAKGAVIPHAFFAEDGKKAFVQWYAPIKGALNMEVMAEGISDEESNALSKSHPWPTPRPLEERIVEARKLNTADCLIPQDVYVSVSGQQYEQEGLSHIGIVPIELRGLYLLGVQMSKDVSDEEHRRNILESGKVEYDNERMEYSNYLDVRKDPLFAGMDIVFDQFVNELEKAFPAIAANENRRRMFYLDEHWNVFTSPDIQYRDEAHRAEVEAGADRLRQLLGEPE